MPLHASVPAKTDALHQLGRVRVHHLRAAAQSWRADLEPDIAAEQFIWPSGDSCRPSGTLATLPALSSSAAGVAFLASCSVFQRVWMRSPLFLHKPAGRIR